MLAMRLPMLDSKNRQNRHSCDPHREPIEVQQLSVRDPPKRVQLQDLW
jgi:hypothetical protein